VKEARVDDAHVITLTGDVDFGRRDDLDGLAAGFEASDATVARVRMADVTFLDSRGLGFLVRLRNIADARGGHVEVVEPSEPVVNLLRLVNLDGRFQIVDG
jgi:anti-sigma B factor antagonist